MHRACLFVEKYETIPEIKEQKKKKRENKGEI